MPVYALNATPILHLPTLCKPAGIKLWGAPPLAAAGSSMPRTAMSISEFHNSSPHARLPNAYSTCGDRDLSWRRRESTGPSLHDLHSQPFRNQPLGGRHSTTG